LLTSILTLILHSLWIMALLLKGNVILRRLSGSRWVHWGVRCEILRKTSKSKIRRVWFQAFEKHLTDDRLVVLEDDGVKPFASGFNVEPFVDTTCVDGSLSSDIGMQF